MAEMNGTGSVGGNAQNIPEAHVPRTRSSFPLKAHRFNTERYGEYTPIIAFESVKEDRLPVRLSHQLLSYTMKKPLMSELTKIKDLFSVPMEAILPLNWEKFYDNPVRGDDVVDEVGPSIANFWYKTGQFIGNLYTYLTQLLSNNSTTDAVALQASIRFLTLAEYFYSDGSLMATLGCHGSRYGRFDRGGEKFTVDEVADYVYGNLNDFNGTGSPSSIDYFTLTQQGIADYDVYLNTFKYDNKSNDGKVPFRHALCLFRDDPTVFVKSVHFIAGSGQSAGDLRTLLFGLFSNYTFESAGAGIPFNTQFLSAYQLCCSHYFSNDHVDFIYSAELYRQLIGSYHAPSTFVRNGITYRYDFLSGSNLSYYFGLANNIVQLILTVTNGTAANDGYARNCLGLISAVYGFRRSLKYLDYFSGARTQPLAVVGTGVSNTSVAVNNNAVSVIDITRSIQAQRFLNSVNRIGHQFEKYLKGVFGGRMPAPDYHNPFHLANISDVVYGDETQNTGDAQINPNGASENIAITTTLRSNSSKYMFEIDSDRPCIIIAIGHYDVPRVHMYSMDRSFMHVNRFDYFNPFLQYTGDQPIYLQELGIQSFLPTTPVNFAYTMKHMEYKQLYHTASGGFINNLPGFCFPASDKRGSATILSDEWIRCVQSEFDYFYTSLTGYSLASYFHFIVDNFVDVSGSRPMSFAPQILG